MAAASTAPTWVRAHRATPRSVSRPRAIHGRRVARDRFVSTRAVTSSPSAAAGASFVGDDGVPFFALSDADRASELRADPDAVASAAASPNAVLLPLSGTKVWVLPEESPDAPSHVRWRPAEARVRDVPPEILDRDSLSFLGFRARDDAPVFCADVSSIEETVRRAVSAREGLDADATDGTSEPRASTETTGVGDFRDAVRVRTAKSVGPELRRSDAGLLTAAAGLLAWQRTVRFCGECGSPTRLIKAGHKASCADANAVECKAAFYPKLMPAVLTLCTCGDYALLGRNSKWPRGFYSCLAGFVDQSESLEQAVAREVLEESGVVIENERMKYVASQPWPFPCQLMVGFRAEAAAKKIAVSSSAEHPSSSFRGVSREDDARSEARASATARTTVFTYPPTPNLDVHELRDARWFHRDWLREALGKHGDPREGGSGWTKEIPLGSIAVPGTHALARHLIERWVSEGDSSNEKYAPPAVGSGNGSLSPGVPETNRSNVFAVVDFIGAGGGSFTALRFQPTGGGGGAPRERPREVTAGYRARGGEAPAGYEPEGVPGRFRGPQERRFVESPPFRVRPAVFPRRGGFRKLGARRREGSVFDRGS